MTDDNDAITSLTGAINKALEFLENAATEKSKSRFSTTNLHMPAQEEIVQNITERLHDSAIGQLLKDDTIGDILINGPFEVYIDRKGSLEKTHIKFSDHEELLNFATLIATSLNRRLDPRRPLMDARLPDGSRVNIIAPPMAVDGISISIRKFSKAHITLDTLEKSGSMTAMMKDFLKACALCKVNIIISGGTGSGKTTLLNAISEHIPTTERIVSIEDSVELRLQQPHVVRLESKIPEVAGDRTREVNIRDLLVNALRMRPDRIIVGEARGSEAYDMIQAMNTGHDGSMATIHANNPRDAIARMESMVSQAVQNTPILSIRKQIVSAVNFIIQVSRLDDGTRKIVSISEVIGMEGEMPTIQDIFSTKAFGPAVNGKQQTRIEWTGSAPRHAKLATYVKSQNMLKMG